MINKSFIGGFVVGLVAVYMYHRFVGIPSNAPGSKKGA